jgi:hypothetical protein
LAGSEHRAQAEGNPSDPMASEFHGFIVRVP